MTEIALLNPDDSVDIPVSWDNLGAVTLVSVVHAVPSPMTKVGESTDSGSSISYVRITGAVHGQVYQIKAVATLDNGRTLARTFPVRVMNA